MSGPGPGAAPGQAAHAAACAHHGMSPEDTARAWQQQHDSDRQYFAAIETGVLAAQPAQAASGVTLRPMPRFDWPLVTELRTALREAASHVEPLDQNSELAIGRWLALAGETDQPGQFASTAEIPQYSATPERAGQAAPEVAAELSRMREMIRVIAAELEHSAAATAPSRKSGIESAIAVQLRALLDGQP